MDADDAFWAARRVAAFSAEAIEAIVDKARFSDVRVRNHIVDTLLQRRALVLRTWLTAQNPIAELRITNGELKFVNVAEQYGVVERGSTYDVAWFRFDNQTGRRDYTGPPQMTVDEVAAVPTEALRSAQYIGVEIRTSHPAFVDWQAPMSAFFRAQGGGWTLVGLERGSDRPRTLRASR
jgi:hypothetical protein